MTVREAAERLAVNESRVRALVSKGSLTGRRVGNQWLIDAADLDRRADLVRAGATSRSMSLRTAWAAAALADGNQTNWLASSERARLLARLARATKHQTFQRWLASRATRVQHYRCAVQDLDELLAQDGVVATGVSAATAYRLGLSTAGSADAYVDQAVADQLVDEFFLISAGKTGRSNLTLRIVDGDWHLRAATTVGNRRVAPRLIAAIDLLGSHDARSASAGEELTAVIQQDLKERLENRQARALAATARRVAAGGAGGAKQVRPSARVTVGV